MLSLLRGFGDRTGVIAHRGASHDAVENTMAAFELALTQGADGFELDVRPTRCGEVVVFHDRDLMRLLGRGERISSLDYKEISNLRIEGESISTLRAVLERFGHRTKINVELKQVDCFAQAYAFVRSVVADIRSSACEGQVVLSSFDPRLLALVRAMAPDLRRGLVVHANQRWFLRQAWFARPLGVVAVHPEACMVDSSYVLGSHKRGLAVHVWTVDDPATLASLSLACVDAIITNRPAETRRHLDLTARKA